jgi:hypothetical protein
VVVVTAPERETLQSILEAPGAAAHLRDKQTGQYDSRWARMLVHKHTHTPTHTHIQVLRGNSWFKALEAVLQQSVG